MCAINSITLSERLCFELYGIYSRMSSRQNMVVLILVQSHRHTGANS